MSVVGALNINHSNLIIFIKRGLKATYRNVVWMYGTSP